MWTSDFSPQGNHRASPFQCEVTAPSCHASLVEGAVFEVGSVVIEGENVRLSTPPPPDPHQTRATFSI